ncbi:alpha/beta hydrolase [Nocardia puris]|uniref:Alpha-beta hydrolase superfamily lysophospholipase n=1 Tax=Nocardia puris TaxID=208602 RepID=A0A366D5E6_9NOCA|nr:alpha/beta hydrolase [Nocardia puris]RBO85185.1 alpha-beta hydrolase superfamily lysophospholipase [Nocardia puris]
MTDIVFLHGLWISKLAWGPWISYFADRGYRASAPAWPGEADTIEATRANPEAQAGFGIDELTEHFTELLRGYDSPPVVIGHSFGGLLAEKLLGRDCIAGAIAIDPAPIKGVKPLPFAQLKSAFPVLGNPANKNKAKALTAKQFRYGFGNALTPEESDALWERWSIPSPGKPLFEAGFANFAPHSPAKVDTDNAERGPLLIVSGTADHTVPDVSTRATFKLYEHSGADTEFYQFDGRGHSLTIDSGWTDVADLALKWLDAKGFGPR